jgi:hypothetical protein
MITHWYNLLDSILGRSAIYFYFRYDAQNGGGKHYPSHGHSSPSGKLTFHVRQRTRLRMLGSLCLHWLAAEVGGCLMFTYKRTNKPTNRRTYTLTPRSWVFLRTQQSLTHSRISKNFTKIEGSISCPQEPTIAVYPEPDESSSCSILTLYDPVYCSPIFMVESFLLSFPSQPCMHSSSLLCVLHAPRISSFLTWSP